MFALLKSASNLASVSVLATVVAGGSSLTPARDMNSVPHGPQPAEATGWGGEGAFGRAGSDRGRSGINVGRSGTRMDIGDRHRPVQRDIEVAPAAFELEAIQTGRTIVVFARGHNTTGGYRTSLVIERGRRGWAGAERVILRNYAPARGTICTQAIEPFAHVGSFEARAITRSITVDVAGRAYEVAVQRVDALGSSH